LTRYPVVNLAGAMIPVLHPIFSDYQMEKEKMLDKYTNISKVLSLLGTFVTALCFCAGTEIILIVYGTQWELAIHTFTLLSLSIWPTLMMSTTGAIYQSIGNTKLLFKAGLINGLLTIILIIIGVMGKSIEMVAIFVVIANYCNMIVTFQILINKGFQHSSWQFAKLFLGDFMAMIVISGLGYIAFLYLKVDGYLLSLTIKGTFILILYIIYLYLSKQLNIISSILNVVINKRH